MSLLRDRAAVADTPPADAEVLIEEARRRHRRRRLVVGAMTAIAVLVAGITIAMSGGRGTTAKPTVVFRGSGSAAGSGTVTKSFAVVGTGVTVLEWRCRDFLSVEVLTASSGRVVPTGAIPSVIEGLPTVISAGDLGGAPNGIDFGAPTSGSVALTLAPGRYHLLVETDSDDPWRVRVLEPRDAPVVSTPRTWTGSGPEVIGPFAGGPSIQITAKSTYRPPDVPGAGGARAFDTEVLSAATGRALAIGIERGSPFSGSDRVGSLPSGPCYLGVFATGRWTISVETVG